VSGGEHDRRRDERSGAEAPEPSPLEMPTATTAGYALVGVPL
jgi:hypothetical protein